MSWREWVEMEVGTRADMVKGKCSRGRKVLREQA